jgi:hypothetical protein
MPHLLRNALDPRFRTAALTLLFDFGFRRRTVSQTGYRATPEVCVPGQFMIGTLLMLFFGLPSMMRSL